MAAASEVLGRQGAHHLGRKAVHLRLTLQGFGKTGTPRLNERPLGLVLMPVPGREQCRLPATPKLWAFLIERSGYVPLLLLSPKRPPGSCRRNYAWLTGTMM